VVDDWGRPYLLLIEVFVTLNGIALRLVDGEAWITPCRRITSVKPEGAGGPFVKKDQTEKRRHFYENIHKNMSALSARKRFFGVD